MRALTAAFGVAAVSVSFAQLSLALRAGQAPVCTRPGQLSAVPAAMAGALLRELKDIQAMLAPSMSGSPRIGAGPPPRPAAVATATSFTSSDDEATAPPLPLLPPPPASPGKHTRDLERQAAALRQEVAEANDRCRLLDGALQAARHDGSLAVAALQSQLEAKAEEVDGLAQRQGSLRDG